MLRVEAASLGSRPVRFDVDIVVAPTDSTLKAREFQAPYGQSNSTETASTN